MPMPLVCWGLTVNIQVILTDFIKIVDDVNDNQTWHLLDVDYHMPSSRIELTAKLTIEPGVTLLFPANTQFGISQSGTLNAVGTALQPITFTGLEQSAVIGQVSSSPSIITLM
jgi:hypothetical protein